MLKFSILSVVLCGFLVFSAGSVWADDVSDLKEQVKALQETINNQQKTIESLSSKVQAVETKQQSQAAEIKKVPELAKAVDAIKESPAGLMEGASIGGHLKFYMFDESEGIVRGANGENKDAQHNHISAGVNALYLYFSKELSDILKLEIQTETSVSASATPTIGSTITRASSSTTETEIHQAFLTALLPKGAELKVGTFNAMFSEEYSKETWWSEQYHQNDGLAYLQSWHDTGIELYKNFDFDKFSLPVYLSVLNGNSDQYVDNNSAKTVLLHIAPELFHTQLRLLGSVGLGNWGNQDGSFHSLAGFDWKHEKLNITSEYIYRKWDNVVTTGAIKADGKKEGYYARIMYTFNPEWNTLVKYSHAEIYKTGSSTMLSNNYDTTTLGLNYNFTPSSTVMADYSLIYGERSDSLSSIRANRYTIGWRTTF